MQIVIRENSDPSKSISVVAISNTEANAGKWPSHQNEWAFNKTPNISIEKQSTEHQDISLSVDNMALKLEVMEFLLSVHFKQSVLCALTLSWVSH